LMRTNLLLQRRRGVVFVEKRSEGEATDCRDRGTPAAMRLRCESWAGAPIVVARLKVARMRIRGAGAGHGKRRPECEWRPSSATARRRCGQVMLARVTPGAIWGEWRLE
jgi:hypothetical protein